MSSIRRFAWIAVLVCLALASSAYLFARSQSADFDRHAHAIEAFGNVRHLDERIAQQVLAARFGLLNQYDPIMATELASLEAAAELRVRIGDVVPLDRALLDALGRLDQSTANQRLTVERFKAENSVLKNSLYYLPTAGQELESGLQGTASNKSPEAAESALVIQRLVQSALVYNLVGDETTRSSHLRAFAELESRRSAIPSALHGQLGFVLAHARVIGQRQVSVDRWVKQVVDSDTGELLSAIERSYNERFGRIVATSNVYRRVLYGWSIMLVLAVALAGLQLRRVYAGLEHLVVARTRELESALSALWGEMKLASKIQLALVPTSPVVSNCEVAASMRPTEAVGGDYYDVIQVADKEWILIGDVSGHGVPAGLVMMMCQTAVRTVLRSDPNIMPDRLLAIVNTVLTENIRQLGEDKYMTISALRRDADGTVLYAGAHQDINVYRSETDSVETFETSGVWLGLKDDIGASLTTRSFELGTRDVLLLYTDGIIEAKRDGAMFDTAGVRRVLALGRDKSAQQLLTEIFTELEGFELTDDATCLVIKQLAASPEQSGTAHERAA